MRSRLMLSFSFVLGACLLSPMLSMGCKEKTAEPNTEVVTEKPAETSSKVNAPEKDGGEQAEVKEKEGTSLQKTPLIWKIDGEQGPVYMLGTIHLGFDAEKELPKGVWSALDKSEVFVMETDLTQAQAEMASSAKLPDGETLEKKLGEEYWKKLDKRMGGIAAQFNSVKPWFIVSILILKMVPEVNATPPMDQTLHVYAKRHGKKIEHLESPQLQLNILEKTLTIDELKEMLDDFDQQRKDLLAMLEYYRDGDLEGIQKVSFKDREEKAEMYEVLFYERNEKWVVEIDEYAKRGKVFMAFGAGHLFGPRGVLELLEKKGYKPVRVTLEELENEENAAP